MGAAERSFVVRPARPEDVEAAGPLSLEPPGGLNGMIPDRTARLRIAGAAFQARGTGFSFERTLVTERDGLVVGLMARFPGSAWPRIRVRTGLIMLRAAGFRWGPRLLRRGLVEERDMLPIPADVLYVMSLAVHPAWQSRGIGRELLRRAAEEAGRAGLRALALDVALTNEGAMRLYQREGFAQVEAPGLPVALGPRRSRPLRMERSLLSPSASHTDSE